MENEEKNLSEEGLGDIIKERDKALTETLKEQQNPQDPNTVEKELEERAKQKELKKKLNDEIEGNTRGSTSFSDPLRFQKQLTEFNQKFPMPTLQDVSETYADFKIGTMGGSLISDYVPLPPAVTTALTGAAAATVGKFKKHIFDAIDSTGITQPFKIAIRGDLLGDTTLGIPKPKRALFDESELKRYIDEAFNYRKARLEEKTVQGFSPLRVDLMKGFGKTVKNKSGQEFILVRKRKVPNTQVREAIENYQLRSLWSVEDQLVKKRGFEFNRTPQVAELNKLKIELNKFKNQHGDKYYAALMDQGERAYLEHKVARGQSWFWRRKERDFNFAPWVDARNRNDIENLRLLFREPYKQIKDATEMRLVARNNPIKNDLEKLVIDIEDPLSGDIFKRSNPGNLLIRRADDGQIVGLIGDFYQELYSEAFKKNYSVKRLRRKGVPDRYKANPGETLSDYRDRIFNEKLDEAFAQTASYRDLQEQSLTEMAEFFDTFDEQLGMIDTPQWVKNVQSQRFGDPASLDIDDFNRRDLKAIQASKEIDNSLLRMVEEEEVAEKTAGKFGVYTDMEDPNLFEAAQKMLEDFRAKTPVGEQGVLGEIGEEQARSRLMKILFDKYGAK